MRTLRDAGTREHARWRIQLVVALLNVLLLLAVAVDRLIEQRRDNAVVASPCWTLHQPAAGRPTGIEACLADASVASLPLGSLGRF